MRLLTLHYIVTGSFLPSPADVPTAWTDDSSRQFLCILLAFVYDSFYLVALDLLVVLSNVFSLNCGASSVTVR